MTFPGHRETWNNGFQEKPGRWGERRAQGGDGYHAAAKAQVQRGEPAAAEGWALHRRYLPGEPSVSSDITRFLGEPPGPETVRGSARRDRVPRLGPGAPAAAVPRGRESGSRCVCG